MMISGRQAGSPSDSLSYATGQSQACIEQQPHIPRPLLMPVLYYLLYCPVPPPVGHSRRPPLTASGADGQHTEKREACHPGRLGAFRLQRMQDPNFPFFHPAGEPGKVAVAKERIRT